jgi:predicted DNA-binding helix-hairpin-helix protein
VNRSGKGSAVGNSTACGICHSFSSDGPGNACYPWSP